MRLSRGDAPEHDATHGGVDDRFAGFRQTLVVTGQPARARQPSEGALDDPSARDDVEALRLLLQAVAPEMALAVLRHLDAPAPLRPEPARAGARAGGGAPGPPPAP